MREHRSLHRKIGILVVAYEAGRSSALSKTGAVAKQIGGLRRRTADDRCVDFKNVVEFEPDRLADLDLISMSARPITEELLQQVSEDLRTRYDLDEEDVRVLGARLADQDRTDLHDENIAFAQQFTAEHRETFERLGQ